MYIIGGLAMWPSFRTRVHSALMAHGGQISSAAGVAAMIGDHPIEKIKATTQRCFYGVNFSLVTLKHIEENTPNPELFALANRARFDEVDWFVSHSWRDNPPAKFRALQQARNKFCHEHKREPVVWIDKFCLDQTAIEANLMCLPVFLAACKELVIVCGPTCEF